MGKGMSAHQRSEETATEWLTPPYIIEALGEFDLDPCFSGPRPWDTAREHYGEFGLMRPWFGRVWLNPPYGLEAAPWMRAMARHNHGIALLFARTETDMFQCDIFPAAASLLFIKQRLHFHRLDGVRAEANSGSPSVLIAYGQSDSEILKNCKLDGYFVKLR